jgi:choline dehydrogenase-like flavoprotein
MKHLDFPQEQWDAIIIGTGVGGATLGYALARAGQRVLFCEMGRSQLDNPQRIRGAYPEIALPRSAMSKAEMSDFLANAGRCADRIEDQSSLRRRTFIPFIGSGTGGSSALYGMALERFSPADFEPKRCYPDVAETSLPERWPISYTELAPYYKAAEALYRVRGGADPLREAADPLPAPPPLTPVGTELFDFFRRKGLHPYRLPMACEFVDGCGCCQGYLCDRKCKNDSSRVCLEPAVTLHGADLLVECEVRRLEATAEKVSGVICVLRGREIRLRGNVVVLAAGALQSPCILLASASVSWPQGLANDSGLVGRNLMRHYTDLYLLSPAKTRQFHTPLKELAFNDFFHVDGEKLGTVQSFGSLPPASLLAASMEDDLRNGALAWSVPLFKMAKPVVERMLRGIVARKTVLATVLEDLPYRDNAVRPVSTPGGKTRLGISYRIRAHDSARISRFRAIMKDVLRPYRVMLVKQAENNQRLAHVCGTCRFGTDPKDSVLDANNRAHGLSNLYVVDGSFFPSSSGTNPALTIAANALRVADHLIGRNPAPR